MKSLHIALLLGAIVTSAVILAGACGTCGTPAKEHKKGNKHMDATQTEARAAVEAAGIKYMSAADLKAGLASGKPPVVVNVLDSESYVEKHIAGSVNIPMDKVGEIAPVVLPDKSARIVTYCGSYKCGASTAAAVELKKLGYTNVYDYKGGMKEWEEMKLPLEGKDVK